MKSYPETDKLTIIFVGSRQNKNPPSIFEICIRFLLPKCFSCNLNKNSWFWSILKRIKKKQKILIQTNFFYDFRRKLTLILLVKIWFAEAIFKILYFQDFLCEFSACTTKISEICSIFWQKKIETIVCLFPGGKRENVIFSFFWKIETDKLL